MKKIEFASVLPLMASLSGCASKPYTQAQLGYANTTHKNDLGGHVDLLCVRARGGAKIGKEQQHEFRLGADICYGKLPSSTSWDTYSVDVPIVGTQQTDVYGATKSNLVKISIPFLEYRYGTLEADIPGDGPAEMGIRSSEAKDISLGMWAGAGYDVDITISETDYVTTGGALKNIPGVDVEGKFYGELNNEVTLFGKIPLGMSVRVDKDGKVMPLFMGGYKLQW